MTWILVRQQDGPSKGTFKGAPEALAAQKRCFLAKNGHFEPLKEWRKSFQTYYAHFLTKLEHLGQKKQKKNNKITTLPKSIEYIPVL